MPTVDEALKEALTPPDHYYGAITDLVRQGWAQVAGVHRDSDVLAQSNWETMLKHYNKKYELNEDYRVEHSSHWLVGWNDALLVRALQCECEDWETAEFYQGTVPLDNDTTDKGWLCHTCGEEGVVRDIFTDALGFADALDIYPVLDEDDYSRREYEELMEYLGHECEENELVELAEYLFDNYSVSCVDDIEHKWIDEWKKARPKNWRVTVYGPGMKEIATWEMKDISEAEADDKAWKDVQSDYPDHYDWQLEDDSE